MNHLVRMTTEPLLTDDDIQYARSLLPAWAKGDDYYSGLEIRGCKEIKKIPLRKNGNLVAPAHRPNTGTVVIPAVPPTWIHMGKNREYRHAPLDCWRHVDDDSRYIVTYFVRSARSYSLDVQRRDKLVTALQKEHGSSGFCFFGDYQDYQEGELYFVQSTHKTLSSAKKEQRRLSDTYAKPLAEKEKKKRAVRIIDKPGALTTSIIDDPTTGRQVPVRIGDYVTIKFYTSIPGLFCWQVTQEDRGKKHKLRVRPIYAKINSFDTVPKAKRIAPWRLQTVDIVSLCQAFEVLRDTIKDIVKRRSGE